MEGNSANHNNYPLNNFQLLLYRGKQNINILALLNNNQNDGYNMNMVGVHNTQNSIENFGNYSNFMSYLLNQNNIVQSSLQNSASRLFTNLNLQKNPNEIQVPFNLNNYPSIDQSQGNINANDLLHKLSLLKMLKQLNENSKNININVNLFKNPISIF